MEMLSIITPSRKIEDSRHPCHRCKEQGTPERNRRVRRIEPSLKVIDSTPTSTWVTPHTLIIAKRATVAVLPSLGTGG